MITAPPASQQLRLLFRAAVGLLFVLLPSTSIAQETPAPPPVAPPAAELNVEHTIGGQPGAPAYPPHLRERIAEFFRAQKESPPPRTRHLREDGGAKYTNRLILENSPYLLQHAHNPVDWHPWGDEAFALAKELGRPVLLSVGYTTCHWCHVMEEESFEDPEIARFINENYVAIKVDRERRPDVDAIYMDAVRMFSRRGGWPMTVAMTPDREPFFGGTYFPARDGDRGSGVGFLTILQKLSEVYTNEPERIAEVTKSAVEELRKQATVSGPTDLPTPFALEAMAARLWNEFDTKDGGFGRAPKFPRPATLDLLLRYHRRTQKEEALRMVQLTLEKMAGGGMYDHVGSGFHRYSTDAFWLVPHFEKMLYDNAQLVRTYLHAHRVTRDPEHARIARDLLDYVIREMTAPGGGFYSATDADSKNPEGHTEEGWFFTWTPADIDRLLDGETQRVFLAHHPITDSGNFEGRNILHAPQSRDATATDLSVDRARVDAELAKAYATLYAERETRPRPILDDKILTGWNGLMISAMVEGALTLGDAQYLAAAQRAAEFLEANLVDDGELRRSWRRGQSSHRAVLDDYAFLIAAYLDLFEASHEVRWFDRAVALQMTLDVHFWDESGGGYYLASALQEGLLVRQKPAYDGAVPSGNSVTTLNLIRLARATTDDRYRARAERCLRTFSSALTRSVALPTMGSALDAYTDPGLEIILVRPDADTSVSPFLDALRTRFLPNALVVVTTPDEIPELKQRIPLVEGKTILEGRVTAYVCERGVCQLPTTDAAVFAEQIGLVHPYPTPASQPAEPDSNSSPPPSPGADAGGSSEADGGR